MCSAQKNCARHKKTVLGTEKLCDEAYTKGVKDTKRKLLFCWLIGALGAAVALAFVPGKKDVRSLVTTTLSAGSVAFVVSVLVERKQG